METMQLTFVVGWTPNKISTCPRVSNDMMDVLNSIIIFGPSPGPLGYKTNNKLMLCKCYTQRKECTRIIRDEKL
uniref:Ovule protein n=1 Tax=Romanomermis culicivorax TaxID=13658 RepID=A0A915K515_ROMCU